MRNNANLARNGFKMNETQNVFYKLNLEDFRFRLLRRLRKT